MKKLLAILFPLLAGSSFAQTPTPSYPSAHPLTTNDVFYVARFASGTNYINAKIRGDQLRYFVTNGISFVILGTGGGTVTSVGIVPPDILTATADVTVSGDITLAPVDPGADRIVGWDDSAGKWVYYELGTGFEVDGTTINSGGVPGGSNGQVQFNGTGAFSGDPDFTFANGHTLSVGNLTVATNLVLTATGGTSHFLRQASAGGPVTSGPLTEDDIPAEIAQDNQIASEVPFTSVGAIDATDVQAAIAELQSDTTNSLAGKVDKGFTITAGTGLVGSDDLSGMGMTIDVSFDELNEITSIDPDADKIFMLDTSTGLVGWGKPANLGAGGDEVADPGVSSFRVYDNNSDVVSSFPPIHPLDFNGTNVVILLDPAILTTNEFGITLVDDAEISVAYIASADGTMRWYFNSFDAPWNTNNVPTHSSFNPTYFRWTNGATNHYITPVIQFQEGGTTFATEPILNLVAGSNVTITESSVGGKATYTIDASGGGATAVTASGTFGADNVLVRSDGTSRGVKPSGITVDNDDNMTGINTIEAEVMNIPNIEAENAYFGTIHLTNWSGLTASVRTHADLLALTAPSTNLVVVSADPMSGGLFRITNSATANGGTVYALNSSGWYAVRMFDGPVKLAWFRPTADGSTSDTTPWQAALTAAAAAPSRSLDGYAATFKINGTLTAGSVYVNLRGARIIGNSSGNIFVASGSIGSYTVLDSTAVRGATNIFSALATSLSKGDVIQINSNADFSAQDAGFKQGELAIVHSIISTDQITLESPLNDTYTTGDGAKVAKITPVIFGIENGTIEQPGGTILDKGFEVIYGLHPYVRNVRFQSLSESAIRIWSSVNPSVRDCTILDTFYATAGTEYGIQFNSCLNPIASHNTILGARHCIDFSGVAGVTWGGVAEYNYVSQSAVSPVAALNTHGSAGSVTFRNNEVWSAPGAPCFQNTARYGYIHNNIAHGGSIFQSVVVTGYVLDTMSIVGNRWDGGTAEMVLLTTPTITNLVFQGNHCFGDSTDWMFRINGAAVIHNWAPFSDNHARNRALCVIDAANVTSPTNMVWMNSSCTFDTAQATYRAIRFLDSRIKNVSIVNVHAKGVQNLFEHANTMDSISVLGCVVETPNTHPLVLDTVGIVTVSNNRFLNPGTASRQAVAIVPGNTVTTLLMTGNHTEGANYSAILLGAITSFYHAANSFHVAMGGTITTEYLAGSPQSASGTLTGDGDGAFTFTGGGNGSDETLTINLDDTADQAVVSSSTSVTNLTLSGITYRGTMQRVTSLAADDTYEGEILTGLPNTGGVTQWDAVYLNGSSQWALADADGASTYPVRGLVAATTATAVNTIIVTRGVVRNDAWAWTPGGTVYLDDVTPGGLTQTPPATSTDAVQAVGFALTADVLFLNIPSTYVPVP